MENVFTFSLHQDNVAIVVPSISPPKVVGIPDPPTKRKGEQEAFFPDRMYTHSKSALESFVYPPRVSYTPPQNRDQEKVERKS
mmetsp:Transcript_12905/g.16124  ORF Transcript_12905/g.16124 Transcript_12905/m.16124 type:complete len:83 (-) Transcript_12905:40-288(-)